MKKRLYGVVLFVVMVMMSVSAYAGDLRYGIGLKGWSNDWDLVLFDSGNNNVSAVSKADAQYLVGPSIKLSTGNFFAGLSYAQTISDYEYTRPVSLAGNYPGGGGVPFSFSVSLEEESDRKDLDLVVGYMVHPRFGFIVGYKSIKSDGDMTTNDFFLIGAGGLKQVQCDDGVTSRMIEGHAYGITGNMPVGKTGLVLIANAVYMPNLKENMTLQYDVYYRDIVLPVMNYDHTETVSSSYLMEGLSYEIGLVYQINQVSLSLGYKRQKFDYDLGGDSVFKGVTFGVDYMF